MRRVIKVGSGALVEGGRVNTEAFCRISGQVAGLAGRAAIVTSGFAAAGGGKETEQYQAGGKLVLDAWREALGGLAGEMRLVGRDNFAEVVSGAEADMLEGRIPLINGRFGDEDFGNNDQLAAELAVALDASRVAFLGNVDGVYERFGDESSLVSDIRHDEVLDYLPCAGAIPASGTGGIQARLLAGGYAAERGITSLVGYWQAFTAEGQHGAGTVIHPR